MSPESSSGERSFTPKQWHLQASLEFLEGSMTTGTMMDQIVLSSLVLVEFRTHRSISPSMCGSIIQTHLYR